jgi:MFS transporter, MHS family, proline/betaine transporter
VAVGVSWLPGIPVLALGLGSGMAVASVLLLLEQSDAGDIGWWRLAFILALPPGTGGRLRSAPGRRDESVPRCQAGWTGDQATDPQTLANDRTALIRGFALIAAGSVAFDTFFIFMPNHLAALGAGPKPAFKPTI